MPFGILVYELRSTLYGFHCLKWMSIFHFEEFVTVGRTSVDAALHEKEVLQSSIELTFFVDFPTKFS